MKEKLTLWKSMHSSYLIPEEIVLLLADASTGSITSEEVDIVCLSVCSNKS